MLKHEHEHDERRLARIKRECMFGLTALVAAGIAASTAAIGPVATTALIGAGTGAGVAAATGGKPLKGAAIGGALGAGYGGAAYMFPSTLGSVGLGPIAKTAEGGALSGAASTTGAGGLGAEGLSAPVLDGSVESAVAENAGGGFLSDVGNLLGLSGDGGDFNWKKGLLGLAGGALSGGGGKTVGAPSTGPLFNSPLQRGYLPRTPVQNYQPASNDWYSYGTARQPAFFNNNRLNLARGGALSDGRVRAGMPARAPSPFFNSAAGDRYVSGGTTDGDGTSDSVDAKLSESEYVLTAADVSRIGNGSSSAGARKLDKMRHQIAKDAGGKKIAGRVKDPMHYVRRAS